MTTNAQKAEHLRERIVNCGTCCEGALREAEACTNLDDEGFFRGLARELSRRAFDHAAELARVPRKRSAP